MSFELVTAPGNDDAVRATGKTRRGTKFRKKELKKYVLDFEATFSKTRFEISIDEKTPFGQVKEEIDLLCDLDKKEVAKYVVYENRTLTDWYLREGENVVKKNDDVPIIEILNSIRSVENTKKTVDGIDKIPMSLTGVFRSFESDTTNAMYAACPPIATVANYREKLTNLYLKKDDDIFAMEEKRKKYALIIIKRLREAYQKACEIKGEEFECPILQDAITTLPFPFPETEDERNDVQYGLCVGFYDFEALVFSMSFQVQDQWNSALEYFKWPHNNVRMTTKESSFIIQLAHYYYTERKIKREWYRVIVSPLKVSNRSSDKILVYMVPSKYLSPSVNIQFFKNLIRKKFKPHDVNDSNFDQHVRIAYRDLERHPDRTIGYLLHYEDSNFTLHPGDEDMKSLDLYFQIFTTNNDTEKRPELRRFFDAY